jgi:hypothetical protein
MCERKRITELDEKEQELMFTRIHKINSSKIRLTKYKLIYNALPTNSKFKNRYNNNCFMCKKFLNEDLEHIFLKCKITKQCFQ